MDYENEIEAINIDIKKYGSKTPIDKLEEFLRYAMNKYHNDKEVINDTQYDTLIEYLQRRDPKNKFIKEIGAPVRDDMEKIKLPYWLGGMEKLKTEHELNRYFKKYTGPYSVSEKLDGISALLVYDSGQVLMATRGKNGIGQDISYLVPYLNLPKYTKKDKLAIRGELVMTKEKFNKKYKDKFPKGRSVVNSIINTKHPNISILKDTDFVAYELIHPGDMKQTDQFKYIKKLNYKLANHKHYDELTNDIMPGILLDMINASKYEIDGVIVTQDKPYKRVLSGNPTHSVAFKMQLENQIKQTTVEEVEWNPSKYGKLVPRIRFKTINIGGDNIKYTTGFNAKYIVDNKIGPDAQIKIIRSGDVIPYILEVTKPTKASIPKDVEFTWDSKKLNIFLTDSSGNKNVIAKKLTNFFTVLDIPYINIGIINKFVNENITKIKQIYNMQVEDFITIPGIQEKSAKKYHDAIHSVLDKPIELHLLMSASGIFGTGFGERKLKPIVDEFPDILKNYKEIKTEDIMKISGFAWITSESFVNNIDNFVKFLKLNPFLKVKDTKQKQVKKDGKFTDKVIVFSGFRDKQLEDFITTEGGRIGNTVNGKTNLLVVKSLNGVSSKVDKAKDLDIDIVELETFKNLLKM